MLVRLAVIMGGGDAGVMMVMLMVMMIVMMMNSFFSPSVGAFLHPFPLGGKRAAEGFFTPFVANFKLLSYYLFN